eukprot:5567162-Heterocapsa_arctica.AAC.1
MGGDGMSVRIASRMVLLGKGRLLGRKGGGLVILVAVDEGGGSFDPEDLAFIGNVSPGHHGSGEDSPFHDED